MFSKQPPLNKFPDSFHFGVATADHQFEAYEAEFEDVTDVWERACNKPLRGRATDFWTRYREDVDLAKALGCTMFRFSISWSRVEPKPGEYNEAAFAHYSDVIAAIREAGMEPVLTIVHFAWPIHVEARGGLISPDFPKIFAEYVTELAKCFGKDVRYWIPFNEPTLLTAGYVSVSGKTGYNLPPGLPEGATVGEQLEAISDLIRNVFLAHSAARKVLKKVNPDAQVGSNPHILGLPLWLQRWLDRNATKLRSRHEQIKNSRRYITRPLLEKGKVDLVLATLTHTDEREHEISFSDTYFMAGQTLLVRVDSKLTGKDDLVGKPVAVVSTSTSQHALSKLIPKALPRVLGTYDQALAEIDQGQAIAILADNVILEGLITRNPGRYKLVSGLLTNEPYAAAVARGNQEVLDITNITIKQLKDSGELAGIYSKYFPGEPVPEFPEGRTQTLWAMRGRDVLQEAAKRLGVQDNKPLAKKAKKGTLLRSIQDRGYMVVAVKTDVSGFGYRDTTTGEFSGLEVDLAKAVAKTIFGDASKVRFEPAVTQNRIPLLRSLIRFLDPLINLFNIFTTWINANWWHLGMAGRLPEFMCPKECIGQQDFIGFDYYWGISSFRPDRLLSLLRAFILNRNLLLAPVWPSAMYDIIQYSAEMFPGQPILVVENGCVESAQGIARPEYLRQHIREIQRAITEGKNIIGYLCWSITSNREWGVKFDGASDFGLYHIDLDNDPELKRVPTPAVDTYLKIIKERSVE